MAADVYVKTLARAALIVGGVDRLALQLKVRPELLALWLCGERHPPTDAFLNAVDIVVADTVSPQRIVSAPEREELKP